MDVNLEKHQMQGTGHIAHILCKDRRRKIQHLLTRSCSQYVRHLAAGTEVDKRDHGVLKDNFVISVNGNVYMS